LLFYPPLTKMRAPIAAAAEPKAGRGISRWSLLMNQPLWQPSAEPIGHGGSESTSTELRS
jgi:hypothetical protein